MATIVVLKLLGCYIRYNVLQNRVSSLWWPNSPFQLMDIENGYCLAKFQNKDDFEKPYPSTVQAWIKLPGLLGFLYKWKVLEEIEGLIGKVAKLDFNTNNSLRGKFARMAMYVNLDKHLISQVLINDTMQRVEYESLLVEDKDTVGSSSHATLIGPTDEEHFLNDTSLSTFNKVQPVKALGKQTIFFNESNLASNIVDHSDKNQNDLMLTDFYDAIKLVNLMEIRDVDGDEGKVNSLGLVSPFMIHTNPIFAGPIGSEIPLQDGVLDSGRHLTINFKVNSTSASKKYLKGNNYLGVVKGTPVGKGCGSGGKVDLNRNNNLYNKTIRGSGKKFKATGNSRVPLLD
ncbi:hypothetical protein Golob_019993 [Gossypium lobatum]|uniref:DUF4283 domain-containing protein n=1 Tax=Gossypium lobatum TaxID=34289 RepID=A0A7J8L917_9ROSI|nr:hypothetical protein [Gossypium lobatum]